MSLSTTNKYEAGVIRMRELLGERADSVIDNLKKHSPDFANYVVEFAYGDIAARKALDDKTREAAIVASLISQGVAGSPLKSHLTAMHCVGWRREEILELFILLIAYVGFPKVVNALSVLADTVF